MDHAQPYVAPFLRRLMPDATEAEILGASENLHGYLRVLYRAFVEGKAAQACRDSSDEGVHGRFGPKRPPASAPMKSYLAYIRVSTAKQGQQGSSLQEQRDAILAFAARTQFRITEWYEDRETAAKKGRTQFMRMMAALEKGKAAGVILHKIDRGARNLWDWARIQDLIDAGVEVHFAHDNLDLRSRGGRLAADIQAVVAADYVRNLRDEVLKGMLGRLKQGIYPGRAPVGYLDTGKAKAKAIDPIKGPLVRTAFELYATNRYSYETLAQELQRLGLTRSGGRPLSLNGLTTMLRNPFYMGIIRLKRTGEVFQGRHEPLVDARTFQVVQDTIDGRLHKPSQVQVRRNDFTYRRLLTCGLCGYGLTGECQKGHVYYRCHTKGCETKAIREETIDRRLREAARAFYFTDEEIESMRPYIEADEKGWEAEQWKRIEAAKLRIAALDDRQRRLTDTYVDQAIDKREYNERKLALLTDLAAARDELNRLQTERMSGGMAMVGQFFEPLRTLELGPQITSRQSYREAIEKLTSNRTLTGRELSFSMRSPFQEALCDLSLLFGDPSREAVRFCTPHSTRGKKGGVTNDNFLAAQYAKIIWKRAHELKVELPLAIKKRAPHAHWFKAGNGGPPSFPSEQPNAA